MIPIGIVLITLGLTLLSVWGGFLASPPAHWIGAAEEFRLSLVLACVTAVTHLGGAALLIAGLGAYKAQMRAAYIAITLGIAGTAIGTVQLPLLDILDLLDSWWVTTGVVTLPFLLSGLAVYIGARRFGILVGTKTILARASVVLPAIILLIATASTFLPHAATSSSEIAFDVSTAVIMWTGLLFLVAALIILRVSSQIGAHYKSAMVWLGTGLLTSTLVTAITAAAIYMTGSTQGFDTIVDLTAVAAGTIYLRAGYVFYRTREF